MNASPLILILLPALITSAAAPATAQIWQWVDRDGILTFSDSKPPAHAREATLIVTTASDDPNLRRPAGEAGDPERGTASPVGCHRYADQVEAPRHADAALPADGLIHIADRVPVEHLAAWADDGCLRYVAPYPAYNADAPFTDYAYTRRYPHRLYRRGGRGLRQPSDRRHLSYYHRRHHFGFRQYERDYFSGSYRYRSRVPRYHRFSQTPIDGRSYGLDRGDGRSRSRIYRSGRFHHRGSRVGAGHMRGYRRGSSFGSRR